MAIPNTESLKSKNLLLGQAEKYKMTPDEYLHKVWYHEEAARLGEYMAMTLLEELISVLDIGEKPDSEIEP